MILILIFAEALALYGLIGALLDCRVLQACMCHMPVARCTDMAADTKQCLLRVQLASSLHQRRAKPSDFTSSGGVRMHGTHAGGLLAGCQHVADSGWKVETPVLLALVSLQCKQTRLVVGEQLVSYDIFYKDWPTASR